MTPITYHEGAETELLNEIGYLELRATGLGRRFSPRSVGPRASSSSSRNRLRRFDRASGSAYFGSSGTRSSIQLRKMVSSSWQWLTIAVSLVIGSLALGVMKNKRRAVPKRALVTDAEGGEAR